MAYFTNEYFAFFKELAGNNNKDWFDANRKRYEEHVKDPFKHFLQDLINAIKVLDDRIDLTPNQAGFRINRDIRFSKDKTPYKLNRSAIISPGGTKNKSIPGIYLDMNLEDFRIYGGIYMADTAQIQRTREEIAENTKTFRKVIEEKDFVKTFGEIRGEQAKRIPKEFKELAEKEPLIMNKQWYYFAKYDPEFILREDLVDFILDHYKIARPVMDFFDRPAHG